MGFRKDFTMQYVYGPVKSWRLGDSLGVDLLSQQDKQCSFNCLYCQIGETPYYVTERKEYVSTQEVVDEVVSVKEKHIDYITFAGNGEPTLALNLGKVIEKIKEQRSEKIAVLTNSSLLFREDVRKDLALADMVQCKLDCVNEEMFRAISTQQKGLTLDKIIEGIRTFRQEYKGELCVQIMFVRKNMNEAKQFVEIVKSIDPDKVELNTPLRKSSEEPLTQKEMQEVEILFKDIPNVTNVYDIDKQYSDPLDKEKTERRRGKEQ